MMKQINPFASLKFRKPFGFLMGFLLFTTSLQAQSLSPQTIHAAGAYTKAADFSLSYSVGEQSSIFFYTAATASLLSAGFLQDFGILDRDHLALDLSLSNTSFEGSTRPSCLSGCADSNLRSRWDDGVFTPKIQTSDGTALNKEKRYLKGLTSGLLK